MSLCTHTNTHTPQTPHIHTLISTDLLYTVWFWENKELEVTLTSLELIAKASPQGPPEGKSL